MSTGSSLVSLGADPDQGTCSTQGQTRQVYIYRLVALDTADEFLLGYASGKMLMMQVFTRECKLSDEEAGEKFNNANDNNPLLRKATTSKVTARKSKPALL
ncbi:hypothetical protein RHS01_06491 [Rhizoctonia solani]|uniref:Uncharacterized protein n=1 Tax=Rhizoctonia solani TaxID=456999 RepID=A0A8H7ID73_9AGAM|nr:hypothetical protein RHS01_06491 [Rhizoctonia solani]